MDNKKPRLDLLLTVELLEKIREIAKSRFNAPIHHISKKPEITPTVLKLLELGIKHLEDEDEVVFEEDKPVSLKAKYEGLERMFDGLAEDLNRLRERVAAIDGIKTVSNPDNYPDITRIENNPDNYMGNIPIEKKDDNLNPNPDNSPIPIPIVENKEVLTGIAQIPTQIDIQIENETQSPESDPANGEEIATNANGIIAVELGAKEKKKETRGAKPAAPPDIVRRIRAEKGSLRVVGKKYGYTGTTIRKMIKRLSPYDYE